MQANILQKVKETAIFSKWQTQISAKLISKATILRKIADCLICYEGEL